MSRDAFSGEEYGGLVEEYTITITDSYWAEVPEYNEKRGGNSHMLFLHWLGLTDNPAQPQMAADGYHPSFKAGSPKHQDWETMDGGKTAVHPDATVTHFDTRTDMGKLNERLLKITEHLEGKPDDPLADMDPRDATAFVGFTFKMKREEFSFKRDGETFTYSVDLPVEFLGKATKGSAVAAPAAAPVVDAVAAPATLGARAAVEALAASSGDYVSFQRSALLIDGVTTDRDLLNEILDESGGIWAKRAS